MTDLLDLVYNGFIDSRYLDEELDDDFFLSQNDRLRNDPVLKIGKEPIFINGVQASVYQKLDYDSNRVFVGPRDMTKPLYLLTKDYAVVDPVFKWYKKFCEGSDADFPFVEIAQPGISAKHLKPDKGYAVQTYFMNKGFSLAFPSLSEIEHLASQGRLVGAENTFVEQIEREPKGAKLFFSYRSYDEYAAHGDYKCVGMQFNPFHPMSYKHIVDISNNGKRYKGKYSFRGNTYDFVYDLDDRRYRMHSDVWIPTIGQHDNTYEVFDLIGNFDFSVYMSGLIESNVSCPLIVEPYFSNRDPAPGFSKIGPWDGFITMGVSCKYEASTPWCSKSFDIEKRADRYIDISDYVKEKGNTYIVEHCCDDYVLNAECACEDTQNDRLVIVKGQDRGIFVKASKISKGREKGLRAFRQSPRGEFLFVETPMRVMSFPSSGSRSIVYPFSCVSLYQLLGSNFESLREHMVLDVPLPTRFTVTDDDADQYDEEMEIVSMKGEVDRDKWETFLHLVKEYNVVGVYVEHRSSFDVVCRGLNTAVKQLRGLMRKHDDFLSADYFSGFMASDMMPISLV